MFEEADVSSIIEALDVPAILLLRDHTVLAVNQALLTAFAAGDAVAADLTGRRIDELSELLDPSVIEHLRRTNADGSLALDGVSLWKIGADERRTTDLRITPVGRDRQMILVRLNPASAATAHEAQRRRAGRLAILGSCAAGFAHDINNQLSATLNIASLLREELGPEHDRALTIIEGSAREAAALARRLLVFAGRGEPEITTIGIDRVAEEASLLIRHEMPPTERFSIEVEGHCPEVTGDQVQLQQLVAILLLVGAEAVRDAGHGSLRIAGRNGDGPRGSHVELILTAERDVDPGDAGEFARRIATDHGGDLTVTRGTPLRIAVRLPIKPDLTLPRRGTATNRAARGPSRPTVMVVDDDTMVRDVAVAMVERLGYRAIAAEGGARAIEMLEAQADSIDLVILDLVMRDLDGFSVLRHLRGIRNDVPVILSSGFGEQIVQADPELRIDGMLEKPYSMARLKRVLDQHIGPGGAEGAGH